MRRRTTLAGLLLLLAVGGVVWLAVDGDVFGSADLADREEMSIDGDPEAALTADAAKRETKGAALSGRELPPGDPDAGSGTVEVLVVNSANVPLPGVRLKARPAEIEVAVDAEGEKLDEAEPEGPKGVAADAHPVATTDADGKAWLPSVPYDGTWIVAAGEGTSSSGFINLNGGDIAIYRSIVRLEDTTGKVRTKIKATGFAGSVTVKGPTARLQLRHGMPLRVLKQNASTSATMERIPWAVTPNYGDPHKVESRVTPVETARVAPGAPASLRIYVPSGSGFKSDQNKHFAAWISPLAKELLIVHPQWPEAELLVTLPADVPAAGSDKWTLAYRVDGRTRGRAKAHIDGFGRLVVKGVPFLPGQAIYLGGKLGKKGRLTAKGRYPMDDRGAVVLEGAWRPTRKKASRINSAKADRMVAELTERLAKSEAMVADLNAQMQADVARKAREMKRLDAEKMREALREYAVKKEAKDAAEAAEKNLGKVRVLVRRHDGTPAAGAWVQIGPTGKTLSAKGAATLGPFQPGSFDVRVLGAGAVFLSKVEVTAGKTTPLELDAPLGGAIEVQVVDGENNPLPFATVEIRQASGLGYCDLEGEVQRLDRYTDHLGRRLFKGVQTGKATLIVRYGSRTKKVDVDVRENDTSAARVELALPPAPTAAPVSSVKVTPRTPEQERERLEKIKRATEKLMERMRALEEARKKAGGG